MILAHSGVWVCRSSWSGPVSMPLLRRVKYGFDNPGRCQWHYILWLFWDLSFTKKGKKSWYSHGQQKRDLLHDDLLMHSKSGFLWQQIKAPRKDDKRESNQTTNAILGKYTRPVFKLEIQECEATAWGCSHKQNYFGSRISRGPLLCLYRYEGVP